MLRACVRRHSTLDSHSKTLLESHGRASRWAKENAPYLGLVGTLLVAAGYCGVYIMSISKELSLAKKDVSHLATEFEKDVTHLASEFDTKLEKQRAELEAQFQKRLLDLGYHGDYEAYRTNLAAQRERASKS